MYAIIPQQIPQDRRAEINEKILFAIDSGKDLVPKESIYNCYTGIGGAVEIYEAHAAGGGSTMNVNELLDTIEDTLEESTSMPLSGGKRLVDVEKVRDYLDDIRANLPGELRQAQQIVNVSRSGRAV